MPSRRFGVALLIPSPLDREIDGLRRACGDAAAVDRIPPHVTLVPPVNVREDAVGAALERLRTAAAESEPLVLRLGPAATFHPDTPVLYLEVAGELDALAALRDRVFVAPLARSLTWPFHPHVTLAVDQPADRLAAGVAALAGYEVDVRFDRVHLLEEHKDPDRGRVWEPVADAPLGPARVVGRGGLPLELTVSETVDAEAAALVAGAGAGGPLVVTARREGRVVGVARAWLDAAGTAAHLEVLTVRDEERGTGVGTQLLASLEAALADRGCRVIRAPIAAFLRGRGWRPDGTSSLVRDIFSGDG